MGSEFDVERARAYCDSRCDNDMIGIFTAMRDMLDQGTVPAKPEIVMPTKPCGCLEGHKCAADDTIRISRKVAEEWMVVTGKTLEQCQMQHVKFCAELKRALGRAE